MAGPEVVDADNEGLFARHFLCRHRRTTGSPGRVGIRTVISLCLPSNIYLDTHKYIYSKVRKRGGKIRNVFTGLPDDGEHEVS